MSGTRKLGRPTDQRMAMLRGLVTYLFENGKVETTVTRAKEVRALAEKMITLAKKNTLASYRQVLGFITKESVAHDLVNIIAPKYADKNGGYTRIYKLGPRRGDAAEMALLELIPVEAKKEEKPKKAAKKEEVKVEEAPVAEAPVEEAPAEEAPAEEVATEEAPAEEATEEAAE